MAKKKIQLTTDQRSFVMTYHDFLKSGLLDNHYQIVVFIYLKMFADGNNQCYPSVKTLSKLTKISVHKIKITLAELEDKGIIVKKNRTRPDGGKSSNLYTLYDYKELWNASSSEEITAISDVIEEKHMIEILTSKGYCVTKEKEPESLQTVQSNNDSSTQFNNLNQFDNITNPEKNQDLERYTLDQIKQLFDYDNMLIDHADRQHDIDTIMGVLHTAMNTGKSTIRIFGKDKPAMVVIAKLMKLDKESIMYALDKFLEQEERIKNPTAYLLTILYNTPEQYYLDKKNQERNEMAKEDQSQEEKKIEGMNKNSKNMFDNFKQRTYDYDSLEKELLNFQNKS